MPKTPAGRRLLQLFHSLVLSAVFVIDVCIMPKTPAVRRCGSIAMHTRAHPHRQNTCRHTVWKHCYARTCPPNCSTHLQPHGLEALLYTHMPTHVLKTPAGTLFGSTAIHTHAHPCAQNTCRRIVWKHCYTHECPSISSTHLQAHGLEALLHTGVPKMPAARRV